MSIRKYKAIIFSSFQPHQSTHIHIKKLDPTDNGASQHEITKSCGASLGFVIKTLTIIYVNLGRKYHLALLYYHYLSFR